MPLRRFIDADHADDVKEHISRLTLARFVTNTGLRFAIPFLSIIGKSLGASLNQMGVAASFGDFTGLAGPVIGHQLDRRSRRTTMSLCLGGVAFGTALAAGAQSVLAISLAFIVLSLAKLMFDNSMNAWVTERTDYAKRAQVIGLTEISWAGAVLVGIPLLAVVVYFSNWRFGYGILTVIVLAVAIHLWRVLPPDTPTVHAESRSRLEWSMPAVAGFLAFGLIMSTGQCLFVAFGAWLKDAFGFSTLGIGAVSFLLGGAELVASTSTMRFTDKLGKRRAIRMGVALMIPTGCGLAVVGRVPSVGLALLALFFLGFEFAIVSFIPLVPTLQPKNPSSAFGIAVGLGTICRGITAIVSTRLYTSHGIGGSALLAAGIGAVAIVLLTAVREPA